MFTKLCFWRKKLKFLKLNCVEWEKLLLMYCFNHVISHFPTMNDDTLQQNERQTSTGRVLIDARRHAAFSTWPFTTHFLERTGERKILKVINDINREQIKISLTSHHHVEPFRFYSTIQYYDYWCWVELWEARTLSEVQERKSSQTVCTHINLSDNNAMMVAVYVGWRRVGREKKAEKQSIARREEQ